MFLQNPQIHLKIIGVLLMALSCIHVIFPRYFNWKKELANLSLINRQMMQVHTFFVGLMVLLMGMLCFLFAQELVTSDFGKYISKGLFIFWFVRLIFQLFVYSPKVWKGRIFETTVHIIFTLFWIYMSFIFFTIGF